LRHLDEPELAPFRLQVLAWLAERGAEAVLVRPDRYVFGAGPPAALLAAWTAALKPIAKPALEPA
jgi:3-(3-hydroxy-phenyl)propionate hydroxylase